MKRAKKQAKQKKEHAPMHWWNAALRINVHIDLNTQQFQFGVQARAAEYYKGQRLLTQRGPW